MNNQASSVWFNLVRPFRHCKVNFLCIKCCTTIPFQHCLRWKLIYVLFGDEFGEYPWTLLVDPGPALVKHIWKKQPLYSIPTRVLSLFIERFIWIGVSALWTANCHRWGRPHWTPLNPLFGACFALQPASFWVPDTDMRSQDWGEKNSAILSLLWGLWAIMPE